MVHGRNQDVERGGRVFHVQTEDGGAENPLVTTSLYLGGVVIASKKTRYGDIMNLAGRDKLVADLVERQHREMIGDVKRGFFDEQADRAVQNLPAEKQEE